MFVLVASRKVFYGTAIIVPSWTVSYQEVNEYGKRLLHIFYKYELENDIWNIEIQYQMETFNWDESI